MLDIRGVQVTFGDTPVLRGIDLRVDDGEIVCLLGPSGCGKTTLLRVIAGLETPQTGDVQIQGQSILKIPVHERGFGLMFQDFALFPHLNAGDNVAFGLKMQGLSSEQRIERVRDTLKIVGLAGFEKRDVAQVSGGERQRVALARSLAPNLRLLMLDEPLGSLDAALRERLVVELRTIIKQIGLTAVYVTHDQSEAFAIADRIAVMNAGRIEQIDTPESIYRRPQTAFVARFLRLDNVFAVTRQIGNIANTEVGCFEIMGTAEAVLLHPDGISIASDTTDYSIEGVIQERVFMGDTYRMRLAVGKDVGLVFKLPSSGNPVPMIGDSVRVTVMPEMVIPLTTPIPPAPFPRVQRKGE
ncbi:MAG: ABC transporter ATP-binding protein [Chloroflexota bacterium]